MCVRHIAVRLDSVSRKYFAKSLNVLDVYLAFTTYREIVRRWHHKQFMIASPRIYAERQIGAHEPNQRSIKIKGGGQFSLRPLALSLVLPQYHIAIGIKGVVSRTKFSLIFRPLARGVH